MTREETEALATRIAAAVEGRLAFEDCADAPETEDDAYAVQDALRRILAPKRGGIGGRKIAFNKPGQAAELGLSAPAVAPVHADRIHPSPARLSAADFRGFTFEPEIIAAIGHDFAPEDGPWTAERAAPRVARLLPGFEIMDRRTDANPPPLAAIANGVFNEGMAVGGPGIEARDLDLAALHSHVTMNGEVLLDAAGAAPEHPLEAVARVANHLNARGETLRGGEMILCGAHLPPRRHDGPCALRFACGPLGDVALDLV